MDSERSKIILVDDIKANLDQGRNMLKTFYEVYPAISAAKLFELLDNFLPDLILLDIEMPEMNGYEAIKKLKSDDRFADIPVIFLTAKTDSESELKGFDLGAMDYVSKPFSAPLLLKRIEKELLILRQKRELLRAKEYLEGYTDMLSAEVIKKTEEIVDLQNAVLSTVADMVEFRDKLTGGHNYRTRLYLKALMEEMKKEGIYGDVIADWDQATFLYSAQLHDVGKIAISDLILNKQGKLTPEEFEIIKTHVTAGIDAIEKIMSSLSSSSKFLVHTLAIVGTHHEKWDGSGYPVGLSGKNIPLEGRLMAIADVYDALVTDRPYKKSFTCEEAKKIIQDSSATHFDPTLIPVFLNVENEFARIAKENRDIKD
ncbi:MAG: response regulator [Holophagaceae bacterium]|nr:response regulator [Holophagaceae bacterium]